MLRERHRKTHFAGENGFLKSGYQEKYMKDGDIRTKKKAHNVSIGENAHGMTS